MVEIPEIICVSTMVISRRLATVLMLVPSNPNCTSHKSIVASSPHASHSTEGIGSGGDGCDKSNERLRLIVLNDDVVLGNGYKRERMATRIDDSTKL